MGGNLKFSDTESADALSEPSGTRSGSARQDRCRSARSRDSPAGLRAAAAEMILEGLHSIDKISRSEERGFSATERKAAAQELYRDYTMERNRYKKPLN